MIRNFSKLLIKAGADKRIVSDEFATFDELGMMPFEKTYLINLIEDEYDISFNDKEIPLIDTIKELIFSINKKNPQALSNCA